MEERIIEEVKKNIGKTLDEGIQPGNLEYIDKLVDIYKDIKEVECMQYDNYGEYGRAGYDSYGRDAYGDSYGRRGYDAKYRGEGALEAMRGNYRAYSASREAYGRGNYGAKEDSMKSLRHMLEDGVDFFRMLKADAKTQEELTLIHDYVKKINEM
jgi:hypothetical protein